MFLPPSGYTVYINVICFVYFYSAFIGDPWAEISVVFGFSTQLGILIENKL